MVSKSANSVDSGLQALLALAPHLKPFPIEKAGVRGFRLHFTNESIEDKDA
jgi:hypothetical protein